jgi:hypothetical protein
LSSDRYFRKATHAFRIPIDVAPPKQEPGNREEIIRASVPGPGSLPDLAEPRQPASIFPENSAQPIHPGVDSAKNIFAPIGLPGLGCGKSDVVPRLAMQGGGAAAGTSALPRAGGSLCGFPFPVGLTMRVQCIALRAASLRIRRSIFVS